MINLKMNVSLSGVEKMPAEWRWSFTKDIHTMLSAMINVSTENLLPNNDDPLLESYFDSAEAVKYVVQRLRNVPNSYIVSVSRAYPSTITISLASLGEKTKIEYKAK